MYSFTQKKSAPGHEFLAEEVNELRREFTKAHEEIKQLKSKNSATAKHLAKSETNVLQLQSKLNETEKLLDSGKISAKKGKNVNEIANENLKELRQKLDEAMDDIEKIKFDTLRESTFWSQNQTQKYKPDEPFRGQEKNEIKNKSRLEEKLKHFDIKLLFTPTDEKHRTLGRGRYGSVCICKSLDSKLLAVKCLPLSGTPEYVNKQENCLQEAVVLYKVSHCRILKIHGITKWKNYFGIVTEYLPGKNLKEFLKNQNLSRIPFILRLRIAIQICEALLFIHNYKPKVAFVHGDVKPQNVLLDEELNVKLADFGSVKMEKLTGATTTTDLLMNAQGSLYYTAPEVFQTSEASETPFDFSPAQDVYSFGMVLYELLTRTTVYQNEKMDAHLIVSRVVCFAFRPDRNILNEVKRNLQRDSLIIFQLLEQQMQECWVQDFALRPSMGKVLDSLKGKWNQASQHEARKIAQNISRILNRSNNDFDIETATTLDRVYSN